MTSLSSLRSVFSWHVPNLSEFVVIHALNRVQPWCRLQILLLGLDVVMYGQHSASSLVYRKSMGNPRWMEKSSGDCKRAKKICPALLLQGYKVYLDTYQDPWAHKRKSSDTLSSTEQIRRDRTETAGRCALDA